MKKFSFVIFLFITAFSFSQSDTTVYTYVEEMPRFPGGEDALNNYLSKNIKYPSKALDNNIEGRVMVEFTVRTNGQIDDVKVLRGIGYGCDEEALRVVKSMPVWSPGKQNGKPVNVVYRVPIKFTIRSEEPPKKKQKRK
jgi:protein TonB